MFIQTEATPNPATLKFLPGRDVMPSGTADFRTEDAAAASPLAVNLFAIDGVEGVFFGADFVTVTKGEGEWQHLKPAILGTIMEHFMSDLPLFINEGEAGPAAGEEVLFAPEHEQTFDTIKVLLDTRVRPGTE